MTSTEPGNVGRRQSVVEGTGSAPLSQARTLRDHARRLLEAHQYRRALSVYDRAIALAVSSRSEVVALWMSERGQVLMRLRHGRLAIADFERAARLAPNLLSVCANKATVLQQLGRLDEAIEMHDRAAEIAPDRAEVHFNRANALAEHGRFDDAAAAYQRALEINPEFRNALSQLVSLLWKQHKPEQALSYADRVCALAPGSAEPRVGRALIRRIMGNRDGAREDYEAALERDPSHIGALSNYIQMEKVRTPEDERVSRLEEAVQQQGRRPEERAALHYALGKAYDDLRDADTAFQHFNAGARITRASIAYDENREERGLQRRLQAFRNDAVAEAAKNGLDTVQPIFVVGMPRSGTTLTEQILASHPDVFGAGELVTLRDAVSDVNPQARQVNSDGTLRRHGSEVLPERAAWYMAQVRALSGESYQCIVDKMPGNAWQVGFIHMMFPRAAIIHCVRDPLDTCLSCFQKLFSEGHYWSYDLGELGRHYVRYHRMMQHWEAIMPGRMLTVRYEDTVADLEGQARRILDHVGLPWDPACLAFHETQRPVMTASLGQVREPLYQSSVRKWQHYRHHLGALIEALGPLADRARQAA
jgi:tetratricopeptide (TPR) repeat protein